MADNIIRTISTALTERYYVDIDGHKYALKQPMEFELLDLNELETIQLNLNIEDPKYQSPEGKKELSALLDKASRMVLIDCPEEVHAKLRDIHKFAIMNSFGQAAYRMPLPTKKAPRTSTRKSRNSAGSTAATSITGAT